MGASDAVAQRCIAVRELAPTLVRCTGHKPNVMLGVLVQALSCDVVAQSLGRERKFDIARVASFRVSIGI